MCKEALKHQEYGNNSGALVFVDTYYGEKYSQIINSIVDHACPKEGVGSIVHTIVQKK